MQSENYVILREKLVWNNNYSCISMRVLNVEQIFNLCRRNGIDKIRTKRSMQNKIFNVARCAL